MSILEAPDRSPGMPVPRLIRGIPGWYLRAAVLLVAVALALVAPGPQVPWGVVATLLAAAVVTAVVPDSPMPTVLAVLAVSTRILSGGGTLGPRLIGTALGVYALHLLTAIALGVPLVSRVDPRAFLSSAKRFGIVLVASVPVFAVARAAGEGLTSGPLFLLAALAVVAVLAAALAVGRRRRQADET